MYSFNPLFKYIKPFVLSFWMVFIFFPFTKEKKFLLDQILRNQNNSDTDALLSRNGHYVLLFHENVIALLYDRFFESCDNGLPHTSTFKISVNKANTQKGNNLLLYDACEV